MYIDFAFVYFLSFYSQKYMESFVFQCFALYFVVKVVKYSPTLCAVAVVKIRI